MKIAAKDAINNFLRENNMTAEALAQKTDFAASIISRWRTGRIAPSDKSISALKAVIPESYFEHSVKPNNATESSTERLSDLTRKLYALNEDPFFNETIHIVTASSALHSKFSNEEASNFIYMDNYSDRDALLQVSLDVARSSPGAEFHISTAAMFSDSNLDKSLICIGGPSIVGGEENNLVLDKVLKFRNLPILFTETGIHVFAKDYLFETSGDRRVSKDWSCVMRLKNPFSSDQIIVAIFGHFTWGGRAAAEALSLRRKSSSLLALLNKRGLLEKEFIAIMPAYPQLKKIRYEIAEIEVFEIDDDAMFSN